MSNWRVRRGSEEDLDWLMEQSEAFTRFIGNAVPFHPERAALLLRSWLADHYVVIAEQDGERAGMLVAMATSHTFNPDVRVLSEIMWWVVEAKRNTRAGLLLLNALDKIAEAEKVDLVTMSTESVSPLSGRVLNKRGYRQKELTWVKEQ